MSEPDYLYLKNYVARAVYSIPGIATWLSDIQFNDRTGAFHIMMRDSQLPFEVINEIRMRATSLPYVKITGMRVISLSLAIEGQIPINHQKY